jgi:protein-S-isoprenylcysteine O-methyltransferase Ste14
MVMKKNSTDSAAIRIPPPVYFFACLGCGLLLEHFYPVCIILLAYIPRDITGGALIFTSGFLVVSAFFELIKNKTTFHTSKSTAMIVKEGVYRFSRNPLYLSLLLLLSGIAVFLSSLWLFLTIPILYILLLFKAVKPEEAYLTQKFGSEYLTYAAKTRRWI